MNLRDLHYLVTVAKCGHFGQAAERCNVSQPTLSMQIKKLEDTLGVQLLERARHATRLTTVGEQVVTRAQLILEHAQAIKDLAKAAKNPLSGVAKLGIFPTLAPYVLPIIIPALNKQLPQVEWLLVEEKTTSLLEKLENGALDCALLALPLELSGMASLPLFDEAFLLAVPRKHPLAARKTIKPEELNKVEILLLDDGHCLSAQALELCHHIGIGASNRFRATSLETLRHMVAGGVGATFMPQLAVQNSHADVAYIPFSKPSPYRRIGLVWRKSSPRQALFAALGKIIQHEMKLHTAPL